MGTDTRTGSLVEQATSERERGETAAARRSLEQAVRLNPAEVTAETDLADLLVEATPTWIVTHRPIWGVVKRIKGGPSGGQPYGFINLTQQAAIAAHISTYPIITTSSTRMSS